MTRSIIAVLIALVISGCIHRHAGIPKTSPPEEVNWSHGVTTPKDVVSKWGNPHKTSGNTWIWRIHTTNGGKIKAAYRMIGITISNTATVTREHHLTFDSNGILTDWNISDSVIGDVRWSPWPF